MFYFRLLRPLRSAGRANWCACHRGLRRGRQKRPPAVGGDGRVGLGPDGLSGVRRGFAQSWPTVCGFGGRSVFRAAGAAGVAQTHLAVPDGRVWHLVHRTGRSGRFRACAFDTTGVLVGDRSDPSRERFCGRGRPTVGLRVANRVAIPDRRVCCPLQLRTASRWALTHRVAGGSGE